MDLSASPSFTGADGSTVALGLATIKTKAGTEVKVPAHVMAPYPADFSSNTDTVTQAMLTAGLVRSVAANPGRLGGYVQAGAGNGGKITVTMPRPAGGDPLVGVLGPGEPFKLTLPPGAVLPYAFTISADTLGDTVTTVEFA